MEKYHGYIGRIIDLLPDTEDVKNVQEHETEYIKRKLANNNLVGAKRAYEFQK